jgi:GT2 family glycosyltransferase
MEHKRSIAVVLINYFNDEEVVSFIRRYLLTQTKKEIQIYVLNNGSNSGSLKIFCESEVSIHYEDPAKNLGYIGGFLHVFKSMKGQSPDLLILSNTDLEIDATLFESIGNVELQENEVMIGPAVVSSRTGKNQNPFYEHRISTAKLKRLEIFFSFYLTYACYQLLGIMKAMIKGGSGKNNNENKRHVYAIHGSFMIFKTSFIEQYFDELKDAPFLFGEEIQFAEVAAKHQLKTVYDPSLKVKHHEHATTKLFKSRKMLMMLKDSITFRLKRRKGERLEQG